MKKNNALMAITALLMAAVPPVAQALGQQTSGQQTDPLINKGGEVTVYIGTVLIVIIAAAIVGAFSRRIEHAVFTALGLSLVLIAFFFFTNR